MSYFAKSNFIVYDEWFDEDLEQNKLDFKNKKIKSTSKIHQFFYEQSNYKVGASENNLQLDIKINEKKLTTYNQFEGTFKKSSSISNNKFQFFKTLIKNKFISLGRNSYLLEKIINFFFYRFIFRINVFYKSVDPLFNIFIFIYFLFTFLIKY